jgi:hypothetical protein
MGFGFIIMMAMVRTPVQRSTPPYKSFVIDSIIAQQHPGSPPADYLSNSLSAILRKLDALNILQYLLFAVIHALILPL